MNIKLISHIDKDGYGCNYILKALYPKENIDAVNIKYEDIEFTIIDFFENNNYKNYDCLYITDLSLPLSICELIDFYKDKINIKYYDHHITSLFANKYEWATVITKIDNKKTCATQLLAYGQKYKKYNFINEFIEDVRLWDTWDWSKTNNQIPVKINDLLYLLGPEKWIQQLDNANDLNEMISLNKELLDFRERDIKNYIDKKDKKIYKETICNYKVGIVFAEQYLSQLGNELAKRHPEYDLIIMISDSTVSYRSIKENVNCADIASMFGGGGHPSSAGSPILNINKIQYIKTLFNID